jgi:DNA modification methylase
MTDDERNQIIDAAPGIETTPGSGVWIKQLPIAILADARENPRTIKKAARKALDGMLDEFGLVDALQYNRRTGDLIGGHQRIDKLRRQGVTHVAVAVLDLDETRARALLVGLNNPKAQGVYTDALPMFLAPVAPAIPQIYDAIGLAALISRTEIPAHDRTTVNADTDGDDDEEIQAEERCQDGDLWDLGGSRLLCADSMRIENVERVIGDLKITAVITDPPYAIYGSSTGVASDVADDKMVRPFFESIWKSIYRVLPKFAHAYLFCDWRSWSAVWEGGKRAQLSPKNMLVWDKGGGGLGSSYANTFELVAFFAKLPKQASMRGDNETGQRQVHRPNILRYPKPHGDERQHNAAKNVDMIKELVKNSTDAGGAVLDMFGGSGTTLIAAHELDRRCAMLEMEPSRCDVILARWEKRTGGKATRIGTAQPATIEVPAE